VRFSYRQSSAATSVDSPAAQALNTERINRSQDLRRLSIVPLKNGHNQTPNRRIQV
jgi:hypothetical protein